MEVRVNKLLSTIGFCSRRHADEIISDGRVSVSEGGKLRKVSMGEKIDEHAEIYVNGKLVRKENENIIIAFNKPVGVVCTAKDKHNPINIVDYIGCDKRIYPVGRLDKESEGLILLTNNGELTNRLLDASFRHEKEYTVKVNKYITDDFIRRMERGLYIKELDKTTAPCKVEPVYQKGEDKTRIFKITLIQGLNRQIRRMCKLLGYDVIKLKRIRIMNIVLGDLKIGKYRKLTETEEKELYKELGIH